MKSSISSANDLATRWITEIADDMATAVSGACVWPLLAMHTKAGKVCVIRT